MQDANNTCTLALINIYTHLIPMSISKKNRSAYLNIDIYPYERTTCTLPV